MNCIYLLEIVSNGELYLKTMAIVGDLVQLFLQFQNNWSKVQPTDDFEDISYLCDTDTSFGYH